MTKTRGQHFAVAYYTISVSCHGDTPEEAIADLNAACHNLDFVPLGLPDGALVGSLRLSNPQVEDEYGSFCGHYTWEGTKLDEPEWGR